MQESNWSIAINEFLHVGGALIVIIAAVSIITGFIREFIPQEKIQSRLTKQKKRGPIMGAFLGTLTPFCSASMVPVVLGMVGMGASMGTVFGFLISAPLSNFVVVGLIFAMFGWQVTSVYFVLTISGAISAGYLIELTPLRTALKRVIPTKETSCCIPRSKCDASPAPKKNTAEGSCNQQQKVESTCSAWKEAGCGAVPSTSQGEAVTQPSRVRNAFSFAKVLFKRIIPYVLIGAIISALSAAFLPAELVEKYVGSDNWYAIPIASVIGVPLYLRIEMAIPLLQVLIAKGMGMGAAMALLIGGTGASLPEIAIISSVLKPKAVAAFLFTVLSLAMIGGLLFRALF